MISKDLLLLIVIVNYRVPNYTINCLYSLEKEISTVRETKVVIVDNNSGDSSVQQIKSVIKENNWDNWVYLLCSKHNGGFAYGNNMAIGSVLKSVYKVSYFLLLNPDTEVRKNALKNLINFLTKHNNVGIAGGTFEDAQGTPWPIAFRFPTVLGELESSLRLGIATKLLSNWVVPIKMSNKECKVDWVSGGCMLIRREVFESIGLMDEKYFLDYEDVDFCFRARQVGYSCWYVPQSKIIHIGGQSKKKADYAQNDRKPQYWFESRQRYFVKNHGLLYAALADVLWILGFSLWRMRQRLQGKPNTENPKLFSDFIHNSVFIKKHVNLVN
jgi:GT2 family glycosyltransferase